MQEDDDPARTWLRKRLPLRQLPSLQIGQQITIASGPLARITGKIVRRDPDRSLLIQVDNFLQSGVYLRIRDDTNLVQAQRSN